MQHQKFELTLYVGSIVGSNLMHNIFCVKIINAQFDFIDLIQVDFINETFDRSNLMHNYNCAWSGL